MVAKGASMIGPNQRTSSTAMAVTGFPSIKADVAECCLTHILVVNAGCWLKLDHTF